MAYGSKTRSSNLATKKGNAAIMLVARRATCLATWSDVFDESICCIMRLKEIDDMLAKALRLSVSWERLSATGTDPSFHQVC